MVFTRRDVNTQHTSTNHGPQLQETDAIVHFWSGGVDNTVVMTVDTRQFMCSLL